MRAWLSLLLLGVGCGDAQTSTAVQEIADAGADAQLDARVDELAACAALGGSMPSSVSEAVQRINELPPPASLECLLASLPRPLELTASIGISSLQPSNTAHSPRIFIMAPDLVMSVVPSGEGSRLIEFGEFVTPARTLKAELPVPFPRPVPESLAFEHVLDPMASSGTKCRLCHPSEVHSETVEGGFVSDALSIARFNEMPIDEVRAVRAACESDAGAGEHCSILRALFDYGEVRQGAFADEVREGF